MKALSGVALILVVLAAALAGIYGAIRLLAGKSYANPSTRSRLQDLFLRLGGGFMLLPGVLLMGTGAALIARPELAAFFRRLPPAGRERW
jgi:hypothetical protein